jgi:hypothetical protein
MLPIPDLGVKKAPNPGYRIRIRNTACHKFSVIAGVFDTGDKFNAGDNDTVDKFIAGDNDAGD